MLLMIDNYDSFTYNLVQYFGELGGDIKVYRNDALSINDIEKLNPEKIIISPGPGRPENAGISVEIVKQFASRTPILGVCLGHQSICYAYGGKIVRAKKLMHGKTSMIRHDSKGIFKSVENPFEATRYHSLVVSKDSLPSCLKIIARSDDDEIMGVRHKDFPLWGVQFHPESILTSEGKKILGNFLRL